MQNLPIKRQVADVDEYFEQQKQKEYEAQLDEEEQKVIRELDEYLSFEGIFLTNAQIIESPNERSGPF